MTFEEFLRALSGESGADITVHVSRGYDEMYLTIGNHLWYVKGYMCGQASNNVQPVKSGQIDPSK